MYADASASLPPTIAAPTITLQFALQRDISVESIYWKQFDLDWERAIRHRGLSEFHANRFWSRTPDGKTVGEYKDWSEEDCTTFLTELLDNHSTMSRLARWLCRCLIRLGRMTFDERRHLTGGIYKSGRFKNGGAPSK